VQDWLQGLGIVLAAADELAHETQQPDRWQGGLPHGAAPELLPIALTVTNPTFFYVRLHRRCEHLAGSFMSEPRPHAASVCA
jgi:hypothetical protein